MCSCDSSSIGSDSVYSNSIPITVKTMNIDAEKDIKKIKDLKRKKEKTRVMKTPIVLNNFM